MFQPVKKLGFMQQGIAVGKTICCKKNHEVYITACHSSQYNCDYLNKASLRKSDLGFYLTPTISNCFSHLTSAEVGNVI